MRRRDILKASALPLLPAPALAQGVKPLRFVPHANLTALDPVWTTATVTIMHAYMVYDTLYGIDARGDTPPQMCAGHSEMRLLVSTTPAPHREAGRPRPPPHCRPPEP